ncbi:Na/Pi cotransporter family protein [Hyphobacterium sp. CCMP332]|nr:Na/Pi cotransporter family protein [Hyphobacterium sp. CCMP332]
MNYGLLDLLTLIGALGFFIYGMKIMSDGVQKVAGTKLRQILATMTSNRFFGVITGFLITCLIQSSSATTVMVVSFVNAGLLSLIESIGVIMGANIGTTITAWLISIFGFKVKIADFSLIIIGISFPLLFSKNNNFKNLAETLIGFALLFMGLEALKDSVPDLQNNPQALEFLKGFSYEDKSYFGKLLTTVLFVFIGTILTIVVQSSSAAMALTLVMTNQGWIPFPLAASMVLGENIGTTITANLAALVANTNAKRAARAHFIFNVFGVIWMVFLMPFFITAINWYMEKNNFGSPMETASSVPIGLSIFHTVFNILNVFILIWFSHFIASTVTRLVKDKKHFDDLSLPLYLNAGDLKDINKAMSNVKFELVEFVNNVEKSFQNLRSYIANSDNDDNGNRELRKSIKAYADITNEFDLNISNYLIELSEKETSRYNSLRIYQYMEISSELEDFADLLEYMAKEIELNRNNGLKLKEKHKNQLDELLKHIFNSLGDFNKLLQNNFQKGELEKKQELAYLEDTFKRIKDDHLESKLKKKHKAKLNVYFSRLHSITEQIYFRIRSINQIANREIPA